MGEAISKLPEDIKAINPKIPWSSIKGMRNRLIHEYIGTDLEVVWNVIKNEMPALVNDFKTIHAALKIQHR